MLLSPVQAPLNDKRVRQALNRLIDREAIIRDAYFGSGWNQAGFYLPSFDWHLPEAELNRLTGRDVQAARQMLSAAGVDLNAWKPGMDLGIPSGDFQQVGELIVSNFREIGLEVPGIRLVDKVEVTERGWIRAEPEVCVCNTRPGGGGTNGVLYTWYHTSGSDSGYWKQLGDTEMDNLIDRQAVIIDDPERRKAVLMEIQRRIIDQGVHNQLPTSNAEVAIHPRLRNYKQMGNNEPERFSVAWVKA
jgi:ABC-type transport system substrate-binding protein